MAYDFLSLAAPGVRDLQAYQPGKLIEALACEYGLSTVVKLASNENPLGPGQLAREAIHHAARESLGRYPDGSGFLLKHALARRLGVEMNQITLGNGSNDVLELVARTFVTPADEVIFSEHGFAVYPLVTQAIGAKAIVTRALEFGHDLEAMEQSVTERTRLIFIANPNNPTGTWVEATALRQLLDAVPLHVLVVVDEAYFEYVDTPGYPDGVAWITHYPNLIVTRTFSKIHGLAGLRVGYGISHPALTELMNRVRQPFNVNSLALAAAQAALEDKEHIAHSFSINKTGLEQLADAFKNLGLGFIPSVANFISVDLERPGIEIYESLLRKGVIVRPVANYGLPHHLRVTVGLEHENARFIEALSQVLS